MTTRRPILSLVLLLGAAPIVALSGCGDTDAPADPPPVSARDIGEEAKDVARVTGEYFESRSADLEREARTSMRDVEQKLEAARAELEQLPTDARLEAQRALDRAEEARQALIERLVDLRAAGEEKLDRTRDRVDAAVAELKEAGREVRAALDSGRSDG